MGDIWIVIINGQSFEKETTRVSYAITCAIHSYCCDWRKTAPSFQQLSLTIQRKDGKPIPFSKIAKIR